MRFTIGILIVLTPAVLGGCLINSAYEIGPRDHAVPRGRAVILFGLTGASSIQFDEFSVQNGAIKGNCFQYTRMKANNETAAGNTAYYAFNAPAGYYVLSPFSMLSVDRDLNLAFHAPAGVVSYLGDFVETGEEPPPQHVKISRTENLTAAGEFARSRGLPAPRLSETTPIPGSGPIFVCTPYGGR